MTGIYPVFYKSVDRTSNLLAWLSSFLVIVVSALLLFRIINRTFDLGVSSLAGLSRLIGIWITFLVIPQLTLDERHIKVEYFYYRAPPKVQRVLEIMTIVIGIVVSLLLSISAVVAVNNFLNVTIPELGISTAWLYATVLVGLLATLCVYLLQFYKTIQPASVEL